MATDTTLNRYLIYGTHAQRLAFTPNPASLSGPGPGAYVNVLWTESDISGNPTYAWNQAGTAWVLTSGSGGTITRAITVTVNGGGSVPSTGIFADVYVPFACTISAATMLADVSGSAVIDVWMTNAFSSTPTVANTITASDLPTLSSAENSQDTTLTGWTTSITAGSRLRFKLNSISTCTWVTLTLTVS